MRTKRSESKRNRRRNDLIVDRHISTKFLSKLANKYLSSDLSTYDVKNNDNQNQAVAGVSYQINNNNNNNNKLKSAFGSYVPNNSNLYSAKKRNSPSQPEKYNRINLHYSHKKTSDLISPIVQNDKKTYKKKHETRSSRRLYDEYSGSESSPNDTRKKFTTIATKKNTYTKSSEKKNEPILRKIVVKETVSDSFKRVQPAKKNHTINKEVKSSSKLKVDKVVVRKSKIRESLTHKQQTASKKVSSNRIKRR